ncbi:tRNA (guanosine(37)-N1)-methyltransferase TrmD [Microlunatus speluncae]|uniref:tRNA (guanosine(37)-N1)-methyltransferase TrmD n=1 Tax=Microlunatus speluncae TaxID=2594267 RepID=UPI0012663597|nr:tRNA (guanosine(37)-N1)-methyltransferase TrmD [Microlunatus speluncae]
MRIDVVSIFPEYLAPLRLSLVGKAIDNGLLELAVHDLRGWTHDRHRTVDDTPYGGGAGMVMRPDPWGEALDELAPAGADPRLLIMSPAGRLFDQRLAAELAGEQQLIFACGRYEGIDARVARHAATRMRVDEVSIGDYVLNGGEAAALVIIEAVARLMPGVIGNPESLAEESHSADHDQLLEYPVYTKPPNWRDLDIPEILLSGHHGKIADWRRQQALELTRQRRPDLVPRTERTDELEIRPGVAADAGEVFTLQRAAFVAEGQANGSFEIPPLTDGLDVVEAALARDTVLVARLDGRLVGAVIGSAGDAGAWTVGRLVVVPDLQGRGIGGRLLEAIEAAAPPTRTLIRLITGAGSKRNLGFYTRRGFRVVSRDDAAPGVPIVIMEKPLAG